MGEAGKHVVVMPFAFTFTARCTTIRTIITTISAHQTIIITTLTAIHTPTNHNNRIIIEAVA